MTPELSHDCRQGNRCTMRTRDADGHLVPCGTERPNTLCVACEGEARTAITGLHVDWRELYLVLPATASVSLDPRVSGSREQLIPIRTSVDACMGAIEEELLRWHNVLTGGDEVPNASEDVVRVCLRSVLSRMPTLLRLGPRQVTVTDTTRAGDDVSVIAVLDGVDAVLRLAALHRTAQHLVGATHVTRWLDHVCPTCRTRSLKVTEGRDNVSTTTCARCRQVWSDDELDRWDTMRAALPREVSA